MNVYKQRLLNVVKALRESRRPKSFCMWGFSYSKNARNPMNRTKHPCGTPMCALGHYAAREDLQDAFKIDPETGITYVVGVSRDDLMLAANIFEVAQKHFGISVRETDRLFSSAGCGGATSKTAAARFIRDFAEKKWPVRARVRVKVREAVVQAV